MSQELRSKRFGLVLLYCDALIGSLATTNEKTGRADGGVEILLRKFDKGLFSVKRRQDKNRYIYLRYLR